MRIKVLNLDFKTVGEFEVPENPPEYVVWGSMIFLYNHSYRKYIQIRKPFVTGVLYTEEGNIILQ